MGLELEGLVNSQNGNTANCDGKMRDGLDCVGSRSELPVIER